MMKYAKQTSWKEFVTEQLQTPWNVVYKLAAAKINAQPILGSIKKADGSYTLGWEETVTEIIQNLLPDDSKEEDNEEQEQRRIREELTNKVVPTHTHTSNGNGRGDGSNRCQQTQESAGTRRYPGGNPEGYSRSTRNTVGGAVHRMPSPSKIPKHVETGKYHNPPQGKRQM